MNKLKELITSKEAAFSFSIIVAIAQVAYNWIINGEPDPNMIDAVFVIIGAWLIRQHVFSKSTVDALRPRLEAEILSRVGHKSNPQKRLMTQQDQDNDLI